MIELLVYLAILMIGFGVCIHFAIYTQFGNTTSGKIVNKSTRNIFQRFSTPYQILWSTLLGLPLVVLAVTLITTMLFVGIIAGITWLILGAYYLLLLLPHDKPSAISLKRVFIAAFVIVMFCGLIAFVVGYIFMTTFTF